MPVKSIVSSDWKGQAYNAVVKRSRYRCRHRWDGPSSYLASPVGRGSSSHGWSSATAYPPGQSHDGRSSWSWRLWRAQEERSWAHQRWHTENRQSSPRLRRACTNSQQSTAVRRAGPTLGGQLFRTLPETVTSSNGSFGFVCIRLIQTIQRVCRLVCDSLALNF